jgi:hypothetical protein
MGMVGMEDGEEEAAAEAAEEVGIADFFPPTPAFDTAEEDAAEKPVWAGEAPAGSRQRSCRLRVRSVLLLMRRGTVAMPPTTSERRRL